MNVNYFVLETKDTKYSQPMIQEESRRYFRMIFASRYFDQPDLYSRVAIFRHSTDIATLQNMFNLKMRMMMPMRMMIGIRTMMYHSSLVEDRWSILTELP